MLKDTISAVQEAENQANQLVLKAEEDYLAVLEKAKQDADSLAKETKEKNRIEAAAKMDQAVAQGKADIEAAAKADQKEIQKMMEAAEKKSAAAIKKVTQALC